MARRGYAWAVAAGLNAALAAISAKFFTSQVWIILFRRGSDLIWGHHSYTQLSSNCCDIFVLF